MTKHGNRSVFGLIDWDGKNECDGRVFVLGHGRRYALENCLLDPLLLLALIRNNLPDADAEHLGFAPGESIVDIKARAPERLQVLVDKLQDSILGASPIDSVSPVESIYHDRFRLSVRRAYLEQPGHELERAILEKYRLGKRHDLLDKSVRLLRDHPDWMPVEIVEVFEALLSEEP